MLIKKFTVDISDRTRVQHGLGKGHGVNQLGDGDLEHFGSNQKTLIHELDDESELNPLHTPCDYTCDDDQFLCISSCSCVDFNLRCDGFVS